MQPEKTPGQINFEAYAESVGGKTYDAKPIPPWDQLTDVVQAGWEAGAVGVLKEFGVPLAGEPIHKGDALTKRDDQLYLADARENDTIVGLALEDVAKDQPVRLVVRGSFIYGRIKPDPDQAGSY